MDHFLHFKQVGHCIIYCIYLRIVYRKHDLFTSSPSYKKVKEKADINKILATAIEAAARKFLPHCLFKGTLT
jgi:hypothetical protein